MKIEFAKVPVQIESHAFSLTNVQISATEELFSLLLSSSGLVRQYHISPKQAKRILLLLSKWVEIYEAQFGVLQTSLPEGDQTEEKPIGF